jgi:hypothetical protein
MSYELQDIISLGPDGEGRFQFIVVQTLIPKFDSDEEEIPTSLPSIPQNAPLPVVPQVSPRLVPMIPTVTSVLATVEMSIAPKQREYPYFPDQLKKELVNYVDTGRFPEQWKPIPITEHPRLDWADYDEGAKAVLITLPRKKYGGSHWDALTQLLEPKKLEAVKDLLTQLGLSVVPTGESCHCDNYCPGIGCGYKGYTEQLCLNCAPLCSVCLEPVSRLYNEGTDQEACYTCLC